MTQIYAVVPNLFSASRSGVKQWDLESNQCIRSFDGHSSEVMCIASAIGGDQLLSGDSNGTLFLWDIATGQQLGSVQAHTQALTCLTVTPDGSSFVTGSWDCSLKLWRFQAFQQPAIQFSDSENSVEACVVSVDGRQLFSGSKNSVCAWDMTTGRLLASMQSHSRSVSSLVLSGSLLLSGSYDGTMKLWDPGSMQLLQTLQGHSGPVWSVAATSHGSQLILSGSDDSVYEKGHSVRVWDASGTQLAILEGHSDIVRCVAVSAHCSLAASASDDHTICVWDLASFSLRATLRNLWLNAVLFL